MGWHSAKGLLILQPWGLQRCTFSAIVALNGCKVSRLQDSRVENGVRFPQANVPRWEESSSQT
jgi:hypothetical protein